MKSVTFYFAVIPAMQFLAPLLFLSHLCSSQVALGQPARPQEDFSSLQTPAGAARLRGSGARDNGISKQSFLENIMMTRQVGFGEGVVQGGTTKPWHVSTSERRTQQQYEELLDDWNFCSTSDQCHNGCCSNCYSDDGELKCTVLERGPRTTVCVGLDPNVQISCPESKNPTSAPVSLPPSFSAELTSTDLPTDSPTISTTTSSGTHLVGTSVSRSTDKDSPFPIYVAVVVSLLVLGLVIICYYRRYRQSKQSTVATGNSSKEVSTMVELNDPPAKPGANENGLTSLSLNSKVESIDFDSVGIDMSSYANTIPDDGEKSFVDCYEIGKMLGRGGQGEVFLCAPKSIQGVALAVKIMKSDHLKNELHMMKQLQGCSNIVQFVTSFQEPEITHIVMEYMGGGSLSQRIQSTDRPPTRKDTYNLCKSLLKGIKYCHCKNIAHRDIKLCNLLLANENDFGSVKIADFGFAKEVCPREGLKTRCGTAAYIAPEVMLQRESQPGYGVKCDMWSIGVVIYTLLVGNNPFITDSCIHGKVKAAAIFREVLLGDDIKSKLETADISSDAKILICNLMRRKPEQRWSAKEALRCHYMQAVNEASDESQPTFSVRFDSAAQSNFSLFIR